MKHTIRYIAFCLVSLCAFGMQAQRSFRVHKSDGNMQSFFYSSLDSITFSKTDLNGVSHDNVVVQEFHTTDSVYRIPLADIDSVAFTVPPTVYKPDAVKIEGQLRQYVVRADSLTLWLQGNTPENIIPKNGSNIVTLECDDVLPYGFVGKVRNVEKDGDCIKVDCAQASLFDVFEKVYIERDAVTQSAESKRAPKTGIWPPETEYVVFPPLKGSVSLSEELKKGDNISGEFTQSVDCNLCTESFKLNFALLLDGADITCNVAAVGDYCLNINGSLGASGKYTKEFPLIEVRNIRVIGAASIFELFAELDAYLEIGGEIGLNVGFDKYFRIVMHAGFSTLSKNSAKNFIKYIDRDYKLDVNYDGNVSLSFGQIGKVGIAPLVKEVANTVWYIKEGITFYVPGSLLPPPGSYMDTSKVYDELNRDDYLCANFDLKGGMEVTLLDCPNMPTVKKKYELDFDPTWDTPLMKWGIVPDFTFKYPGGKDYVTTPDGDQYLNFSFNVKRNLASPVKIGFRSYYKIDNESFSSPEIWWSDSVYQNQKDFILSHPYWTGSKPKDGKSHEFIRIVEPIVEVLGRTIKKSGIRYKHNVF